jgi:hypothetical protein
MMMLAHQCAQALDRARLFEAEREARRRAEYLARAGALLADSLSPEVTLEQVARLAVPAIADWAFVELLHDDGGIGRDVIVHRDPERSAWPESWPSATRWIPTPTSARPGLSAPASRSSSPRSLTSC